MDVKIPFQPGDIIQHKDGGCAIANHVNEYLCLVGCFNSTTGYTLGEGDWEFWHKIGTYDLTNIASAIKEAQDNYYDIQTQVNMAIDIMDNTYKLSDEDCGILIGNDMRINKRSNSVYVQVYYDIGTPYTWESILDIYKKYNIKLPK